MDAKRAMHRRLSGNVLRACGTGINFHIASPAVNKALQRIGEKVREGIYIYIFVHIYIFLTRAVDAYIHLFDPRTRCILIRGTSLRAC